MGSCNCIVILGPTATGKTAAGVRTAIALGEMLSLGAARNGLPAEIISADSRQVYRGLDIGSGKDLGEYRYKGVPIPCHLIDVADLGDEYNLFSYMRDAYAAFSDITGRGKIPVIVGGTGMYLDALIRGYDLVEVPSNPELRERLSGASMEELSGILISLKPDLHNTTDLTERHRLLRAIEIEEYLKTTGRESVSEAALPRPDIRPLIFGITYDRVTLRERIAQRLRARLDNGLIEEVEGLHSNGVSWERLDRLGLEYRFAADYLQGKIPGREELFGALNMAIGRFAKRQETWFRGMERKGVPINWLPPRVPSGLLPGESQEPASAAQAAFICDAWHCAERGVLHGNSG
ncbi:MAG: tRNA (adenosine(37)-N6)-dimethylallyltransferase MiaA [Spirochaetaceae bacterium]|jgi:tRNA dimethylallyltransferase|nr:tRNA (adenosine(37)-N6)-dimethylallyltransferase MiaA [Spirochaetaceae bacterium]